MHPPGGLSTSDDTDNFQTVPRRQLALSELGGGHGFTVVFDHHTPGQELLAQEKGLDCAREFSGCCAAVGDDGWLAHRL
jgi:hypothetical protein